MSITPCFIVHSLSPVQLFVTPWTATQQASRSFTIYWTCSNSCPLSLWCYLISHPLLPPSPPALNLSWASGSFPMSQLFASGGQRKYWAFSFSIHPSNDIQGWFPLESTGLICLQSRELSGSPSTPQFESINSLALSLLCGPTLTSIYGYWKNHNFDYVGLCWQSEVSAF